MGCGAAAAISASFNTPLAGVIFALELVMMEYTLASFIPVMLAAASANAVSVMVLGSEPAFQIPELHLGTLKEMPLVVLLGWWREASPRFCSSSASLSQLVQNGPSG